MDRLKLMAALLGSAGVVLAGAAPAAAAHPHYIETPNGSCHAVAGGQTSIGDSTHGGYHQFHHHVHLGAGAGGTLGQSAVEVGKGICL